MNAVSQFAGIALSLSVAAGSLAGVSDRGFFEWDVMEVNVGPSPATPQLAHVFRLHFVANESVQVNGFSLGTAAQPGLTPERVFYTSNAYNHAFGGDTTPNPALIPAFPTLAYDSYFAMNNSPVSFVPGSAAFDNASGEVLGTWFTQPPITLNADDRLFILQLTLIAENISTPPTAGGAGSSIEVGFADNTTAVFDIPLARIPSPGACGMLALAGAVASRRRRC